MNYNFKFNFSKEILNDMQNKSIEEIDLYLRNSEYCINFDFSEATEDDYRWEYCICKGIEEYEKYKKEIEENK